MESLDSSGIYSSASYRLIPFPMVIVFKNLLDTAFKIDFWLLR